MNYPNVENKTEPRTPQNRAEVTFFIFMLLMLPIFILLNKIVIWGLLNVVGILIIERTYLVKG
jgi:hypothetical protein